MFKVVDQKLTLLVTSVLLSKEHLAPNGPFKSN